MPRSGLANRRERARAARRLSQRMTEMAEDTAEEGAYLRDLARGALSHTAGVALVGAVVVLWEGGRPTWWQWLALAAIAVGVPLLRRARIRRSHPAA